MPNAIWPDGAILDADHVNYLEAAAAQGDILVLGLNSDRSVK